MQDFDRVAVEDGDDGPVKSNASTAEKEKMKKPTGDTERISSLRLAWRDTNIQLIPKTKENTQFSRDICA